MSSKPSKPELLAPAGSAETGLAALKAGADAIYMGLQRFNARERGRNCTEDELARLVEYARRKDKRVYLTLNTLIKEAELPLLAEQLCRIAPIRPHAVIVQDLGLLRLLRRHFPELAIHASTRWDSTTALVYGSLRSWVWSGSFCNVRPRWRNSNSS